MRNCIPSRSGRHSRRSGACGLRGTDGLGLRPDEDLVSAAGGELTGGGDRYRWGGEKRRSAVRGEEEREHGATIGKGGLVRAYGLAVLQHRQPDHDPAGSNAHRRWFNAHRRWQLCVLEQQHRGRFPCLNGARGKHVWRDGVATDPAAIPSTAQTPIAKKTRYLPPPRQTRISVGFNHSSPLLLLPQRLALSSAVAGRTCRAFAPAESWPAALTPRPRHQMSRPLPSAVREAPAAADLPACKFATGPPLARGEEWAEWAWQSEN